jgi:hypothetical protein
LGVLKQFDQHAFGAADIKAGDDMQNERAFRSEIESPSGGCVLAALCRRRRIHLAVSPQSCAPVTGMSLALRAKKYCPCEQSYARIARSTYGAMQGFRQGG